MVIVGIKDGVVDICVSVLETETISAMYPEHLLIEQSGNEDIGWNYDGVTFTPPAGG